MATCLNSKRVLHSTLKFNQLTLVDVMCPVCRGIFIEPVTLPCCHGLCLKCFERAMDETSLTCPMCRKRVGSWLRTATKDGKVVNDKLWMFIQKRFPDQVQKKLKGEDDGLEKHVVVDSTPPVKISSPGEIRREYELQVKRLEEEACLKKEQELLASEELIRKFSEEDQVALVKRQQLLTQAQADEEIARKLQDQEEQHTGLSPGRWNAAGKETKNGMLSPHTPTAVRGPMDNYVCQKKPAHPVTKLLGGINNTLGLHRAAVPAESDMQRLRSSSTGSSGSHDSIKQEMHHFKPIKAVPRTPPKRLPDGQVIEPKLIRSTPQNLLHMNDSFVMTPISHRLCVRSKRLRQLEPGKKGIWSISAFTGLLPSPKNDTSATSAATVMHGDDDNNTSSSSSSNMSSKRPWPDSNSASFGLFEVPDVSTPPLSPLAPPLPNSPPPLTPPPPPEYLEVFYDTAVPVSIDYGETHKEECTITEADESIDYVTEADASLGYGTEIDGSVGTEEMSTSSSENMGREEEKEGETAESNETGTGLEVVRQATRDLNLRLKQISADEELARRLADQWAEELRRVDRSKNSSNPYALRNGFRKKMPTTNNNNNNGKKPAVSKRTPSSRVCKGVRLNNQKTIKEAFARTKGIRK